MRIEAKQDGALVISRSFRFSENRTAINASRGRVVYGVGEAARHGQ